MHIPTSSSDADHPEAARTVHPYGDIGLWATYRGHADHAGRPALFLDRDGVIVEEALFLRRAEDVRLMPGIAAAIGAANRAGIPVICITNQSGVARGLFDWNDYAAVSAEIEARLLAESGAWQDAVLACGYHGEAEPPLDRDRRGWRKPRPGMLLAAGEELGLDLSRSVVIGDRMSDLEAGQAAGLRGGILVLTGYGRDNLAAFTARHERWREAGFSCIAARTPSDAVADAIRLVNRSG